MVGGGREGGGREEGGEGGVGKEKKEQPLLYQKQEPNRGLGENSIYIYICIYICTHIHTYIHT